MKKQGTIVKWDEARGFGFIHSAASSGNVFFHVREFRGTRISMPQVGLAVTFDEVQVTGKGPRGMAVTPTWEQPAPPRAGRPVDHPVARPSPRRAAPAAASGAVVALPLMAAFAATVAWGMWTRHLPWWVLPALLFLNVFTFFAYWQDKYAAGKGAWRISESALHLWSLAGGWPGAWFAQQVLRHKSSKQSFREAYWATVALNCGALGASIWWLPGWLASLRG